MNKNAAKRSENSPVPPTSFQHAVSHHNPTVRKEAIFWLGQSDDARATEALLKIVRGQK